MNVILLQKIAKLGEMGDTVSVKGGYARNFLVPQGKALPATKGNVAKFEEQKAELQATDKKKQADATDFASKLKGLEVAISRQASETGMLYGSVKSRDIATAISKQHSLDVPRSKVVIGQPIKEVGEYTVNINLHPEVTVEMPVEVSRQSATAE